MPNEAITAAALTPGVSAQQEQTRSLIGAMLALTGLSSSALARDAGLTPSTLNRFMHQPVRHTLSQRTLLALMIATFRRMKAQGIAALDASALSVLAPALPIFERAILEQAPDAERVLKEIKLRTGAGLAGQLRADKASPQGRDLPVLTATTRGVDVATMQFDKAPLNTQRPPFLADDPHAFGFLLTDDSMTPRYDAGDMLYVSPARGLGGENIDIIVDLTSGGFMAARLTQATDLSLTLVKLKSQEVFEMPRATIRGLYRIVGVQRLGA